MFIGANPPEDTVEILIAARHVNELDDKVETNWRSLYAPTPNRTWTSTPSTYIIIFATNDATKLPTQNLFLLVTLISEVPTFSRSSLMQ